MARITRPLTNNEFIKAKPQEKETMVSFERYTDLYLRKTS